LSALLALVSFALGCGFGGSEPSDEPAIHDKLVFEALGEIGIMAPDGSQRQILPTGDQFTFAAEPVVSPDGKRIAFSGLKDGLWDIYVMNVDGSGLRQLTSDSAQDHGPAWSPAGDSLVFTWTSLGAGGVQLTVMAADGSGRRELVQWGAGAQWSPDGQRVMFYGFGPLPAGIYVTDPSGQNVSRADNVCVPDDCIDVGVRWSPDGEFISFMRRMPGGAATIGIMRADGSEPRLLPGLDTIGGQWSGGIWSPDGRQLAINRWSDAEEIQSSYIITVATGDTVRIASNWESLSDWVP
jgi:TolB protein